MASQWAWILLLSTACGGGGGDDAPIDAGADVMVDTGPVDAAPPDAGPVYACEEGVVVAPSEASVTLTLDTTMVDVLPRDLGLSCGNADAQRWSPQQVVEYVVPGTGPQQVELSVVNDGTDAAFDTVLQIRRERCLTVPEARFPPSCFDDTRTDWRSEGVLSADGGETLYIFVTGYAETTYEGATDRGVAELRITTTSHSRPTLTAAQAYFAGPDAIFDLEGTDADGDAWGAWVTFLDADGEPVGGDVAGLFAPLPTEAAFSARARIDGVARDGAVTARVRAFDQAYGTSEALDVSIGTLATAGYAGTCDPETVCRSEFTCTDGTCLASPEIEDLCAGATEVVLETPTDTTVTASATATLGSGFGLMESDCTPADYFAGTEGVFSVAVPAGGTYDLTVETTRPADTILYSRTVCQDSGSQLGCNDDIDYAGGNTRSRLEHRNVTEGTYTFVAEVFGGFGSGTMTVGVTVSLKPVLATGAACDPARVANRCAAGPCAGGTCP